MSIHEEWAVADKWLSVGGAVEEDPAPLSFEGVLVQKDALRGFDFTGQFHVRCGVRWRNGAGGPVAERG